MLGNETSRLLASTETSAAGQILISLISSLLNFLSPLFRICLESVYISIHLALIVKRNIRSVAVILRFSSSRGIVVEKSVVRKVRLSTLFCNLYLLWAHFFCFLRL